MILTDLLSIFSPSGTEKELSEFVIKVGIVCELLKVTIPRRQRGRWQLNVVQILSCPSIYCINDVCLKYKYLQT